MKKKTVENDVLYIDNHVAIVDYKGTGQTGTDCIKWLLKVGTNQKDELKPIREMLKHYLFRPSCGVSLPNIGKSDLADPEQIKKLGYSISEYMGTNDPTFTSIDCPALNINESFDKNSPFAGHPFGGADIGRYCVDIAGLRESAECVRFVSRLALLALGDARSSGNIRVKDIGDRAISFYLPVPMGIVGDYETAVLRLETIPYYQHLTVSDDGQYANLHCFAVASEYFVNVFETFTNDAAENIAANIALSVLLNLTMGQPYSPDPITCLPMQNVTANLLTVVVALAQDGKLSGCPHCGWPVVVPHPSSDPYCRKSHRTRTDENRG